MTILIRIEGYSGLLSSSSKNQKEGEGEIDTDQRKHTELNDRRDKTENENYIRPGCMDTDRTSVTLDIDSV